jgi:hypothetical protein
VVCIQRHRRLVSWCWPAGALGVFATVIGRLAGVVCC